MKRILSIALCLLLCLSLAVTAFAADPENYVGNSDASNAGLVKVLSVAAGVADPEVTFTFHFEPVVNAAENMNASAFNCTIASSALTKDGTLRSAKLSFAEMPFMSNGIDHAGSWAWTVTEVKTLSGWTGEGTLTKEFEKNGLTITDTMVMDTASYIVKVDVINGTNGEPEIAGYMVFTPADPEHKLPASFEWKEGRPGKEGTDGSKSWHSGFAFNNTLTEKQSGDETDGVFKVTKATATKGSTEDTKSDKTKAFKYTLVLTNPVVGDTTAANATNPTVSATITRGSSGIAAKDGDETVTNVSGGTITLNYGSEGNTFWLSDGDKLVISELPVGVTWSLEEADYSAARYTAALNGTEGRSGSGSIATGDKVSNAFVNTFDPPTTTGIVVNNLPFALIVVLAVSGMAVYFVSNRRKAEEN